MSDDELPPISLNSSTRSAMQLIMPSADILASQRAYEVECEKEVRLIFKQYDKEGSVTCNSSDFSSSEGEISPAIASNPIDIQIPPVTPQPDAKDLISNILQHLPYHNTFLEDYLEVLHQKDDSIVTKITDNMVREICAALSCEESVWGDEQVLCVGAWLCVRCVRCACGACGACGARGAGGASRGRPRVRRALQRLLAAAARTQVWSLARVVSAAGDARTLLRLADAAGGGGGGGGAGGSRFAALLLRAALERLLRAPSPSAPPAPPAPAELSPAPLTAERLRELARGCGRLDARDRYTAAQLLGRALAAGVCGERRGERRGERLGALLAALHQPHHPHANHPEHLKVQAYASKLQLLFPTK